MALQNGFAVWNVAHSNCGGVRRCLQEVQQGSTIHLVGLEIDPGVIIDLLDSLGMASLAFVNDGCKTITTQFIGGLHALGNNLDMLDNVWQAANQISEKGRVGEELFFLLSLLSQLLS